MVGQRYLTLLRDHPWFRLSFVAASPRSAGLRYAEAVEGRWHQTTEIPAEFRDLILADASDPAAAEGRCSLVFSCLEAGKAEIQALELAWAAAGHPLVSNSSAHRGTADVPMIVPEINPGHAALIDVQRRRRGFTTGFVAVKPNCSVQSWLAPVHALREAGYAIDRLVVNTFQAASGAGHPGVASLDLIDNMVPYIGGEEEKTEREPLKILGRIEGEDLVEAEEPRISAHCNRVPVSDEHGAAVSLGFSGKKPALAEVAAIWRAFRGEPQERGLPLAPPSPIILREELDRPQPRRDRDAGGGMAVSVGRLRSCPVLDLRFFGISHNTVRGAAGGAILMAELLAARGYLP